MAISLPLIIVLFSHCTASKIIYQYPGQFEMNNYQLQEGDRLGVILASGKQAIIKYSHAENNYLFGYYVRARNETVIETLTKINSSDIIKLELIEQDDKKTWTFVVLGILSAIIAIGASIDFGPDCFPGPCK